MKKCKNCLNILPETPHGNFCNRTCMIIYVNKKRKISNETREKISSSLKITKDVINSKGLKPLNYRLDRIKLPYSRVHINTCCHCNNIFISRIKQKYCKNHTNMYARGSRSKYQFTFRLEDYPNLFDLEKLKRDGLFHPKHNKNGLTRDHKISINEAIKKGYDPFYIKHPLNCELLTHSKNSSKKHRCSISFDHLKKSVDEYENNIR